MLRSSRNPDRQTSDNEQMSRFIETARAIGADEDEAAFKAKLVAIARQKQVGTPKPPATAKQKPGDAG